jgi:hypothetical protein
MVALGPAWASGVTQSSGPPPPGPEQDHRQPRHDASHRQQLFEPLPPPLAVGHVRQDLANEALAVEEPDREGERRNMRTAAPSLGAVLRNRVGLMTTR